MERPGTCSTTTFDLFSIHGESHERFSVCFLQKMYPSRTIDDARIPKLIALINQDVLRIQDPDFHQPCQIVAGKNYVAATHDAAVNEAIEEFKREVHNA